MTCTVCHAQKHCTQKSSDSASLNVTPPPHLKYPPPRKPKVFSCGRCSGVHLCVSRGGLPSFVDALPISCPAYRYKGLGLQPNNHWEMLLPHKRQGFSKRVETNYRTNINFLRKYLIASTRCCFTAKKTHKYIDFQRHALHKNHICNKKGWSIRHSCNHCSTTYLEIGVLPGHAIDEFTTAPPPIWK